MPLSEALKIHILRQRHFDFDVCLEVVLVRLISHVFITCPVFILLFIVSSLGANFFLSERKANQARSDSRLEFAPPDYVLPGYSQDLPLTPLHPLYHDGRPIRCVRQLNYSNWNPPPSPRRLLGDLIYLFFHTLEDKRYHITACPRGFYVNM